ncbi:MAG: mandelate racemase/muconate lactonizing enzyme family protein [bacterium]|nr:mandelate racemase/muconate lactonizing enzyme family protein [bacterium]
MKITRITATPIRVPRPQLFTSSLGRSLDTENAVVEIETDEGITGLGEVCSIWDRKGRGQAEDINDLLAEALTGKDPFRIAEIHATMDSLLHRSYPAKAGIDMALYDIVGKALNTPVYNLLGGKVREKVLLSHSLSMGEPKQIADFAASLVAKGYKTIKAKIGMNQKADLATVKAVRERIGSDTVLRVDANMGWRNAKEAVRNIKALEAYDIELVEQPLHFSDLHGLHHVREHVDTPIMADESIWTPTDAIACIRAEAVDVFNVYVAEAGGIYPASQIFAIAEAARIPCMIGSMPELGIGTSAQAHLAFAMRNLGYASDVNGFIYHADDIINETFQIDDGYLSPPGGPGLGVTLNRDKVEKYRLK